MKKILKNKKTLLQCTALLAFAGMALACSSSEKAAFRDGFRDGYNAVVDAYSFNDNAVQSDSIADKSTININQNYANL